MSRKKMPAYGPRRRRRSPLPALIILVLAVVSSLIIAGAWQLADPTPYDPGAFAKPPGSEEVPPDASSQGEESAPLASSSQPDAPPPEESQGPPAPSGDGSFTALGFLRGNGCPPPTLTTRCLWGIPSPRASSCTMS